MDATQRLAAFAHGMKAAEIPRSTIEVCSRLVLDAVASAVPAWDMPGVKELRALHTPWNRGDSRVWVSGERLSPAAATLSVDATRSVKRRGANTLPGGDAVRLPVRNSSISPT